jgi:hypothetical protein
MTLTEWNAAIRRARHAYATRPATRWCAWSEQCWGEAGSDGFFCPSHQVWARRKGIR